MGDLPGVPGLRRTDAPAPEPVQAAVRAMVDARGVPGTARALELRPRTVVRVVSGMAVLGATVAHLEARLVACAAERGE